MIRRDRPTDLQRNRDIKIERPRLSRCARLWDLDPEGWFALVIPAAVLLVNCED